MSELAGISGGGSYSDATLSTARLLVQELERGNEDEAQRLMAELSQLRESELFQEMGRLTRQLHDAITGVQSEEELSKLAREEMPEARERLHYVITMTEQAANRTMAAVEQTMPVSDGLAEKAERLRETWQRFTHRELNAEEFRELSKEVQAFFQEVTDDTRMIRENLSEVMMAQDFQDLTGQVIKRVTSMVEEVEHSLVELIRYSGGTVAVKEDQRQADIKAEGPQMNPEAREDVVSGQDDVDDLLSSLGF